MRRLLVLVLLVGCGPPPDPGFAGTWTGTATFQIRGNARPSEYSGAMAIEVVGGDLSVSGVCPTPAASSIEAPASGQHASWSGSLDCGVVSTSDCGAVDVTLQSGQLTLSGSTLTAVGGGTTAGCGTVNTYVSTFVGAK